MKMESHLSQENLCDQSASPEMVDRKDCLPLVFIAVSIHESSKQLSQHKSLLNI